MIKHLLVFQGDLNKKSKSIEELKQQMMKMLSSCDDVERKHGEDVRSVEEEVQSIASNIQAGSHRF